MIGVSWVTDSGVAIGGSGGSLNQGPQQYSVLLFYIIDFVASAEFPCVLNSFL